MLKYAVILCLFLSGCATAPPVGKPSVSTASLAGTYHTVVRGETLWRISRNYGIELEELTRVNRIADNRSIEVGQRIFIPDKMKGSYKITKYSEGDDFIWPLQGRVVSSFGQTDNYMVNKGIKISPYNSQDVLASRSGKVIFVGKDVAGLNRVVIIDHADGLFTVYGLCCKSLSSLGII